MTNRALLVPPIGKFWTLSSALLALAGMIVAGIGLYFIVLRPSLLPEDVRYMGLSAAELEAVGPRLGRWLAHVFRVLGGYALATGVLLIALAATAFRARNPVAVAGALVGGASSIGLMSVVNFMIDSDFKWALLAGALVWALSLVVFRFENYRSRRIPRTLFSFKPPVEGAQSMNPQTQYPAGHPAGHESEPELEPRPRGFWTSKGGLVTIAFLLIAAFFLLSEHRAHFFGFLPFLLLLACPLLHMFMHGGHGGHRGHGRHIRDSEADPAARTGTKPEKGA